VCLVAARRADGGDVGAVQCSELFRPGTRSNGAIPPVTEEGEVVRAIVAPLQARAPHPDR